MAKNLINLAKGGKKASPATKKVAEKKEVEKPISPAEERDLKAKARVEELLEGVQLTPDKKEDLLELEAPEEKKGAEWLEEQVTLLNEQNEALRSELVLAKDDYSRIFAEMQRFKSGIGIVGDGEIKGQVVNLFEELQANYISRGIDPMTNLPVFEIRPVAFMNRLIMFFPFLNQYKRY